MRFSYTRYENAPLATTVSFLGNMIGVPMAVMGVFAMIDGEIGTGLAVIACGAGLAFAASAISEKLAAHTQFEKWWKKVKKANLEPQIASSLNVAIEVYNKNPQERTLNKIAVLNPSAATYIRTHRNHN